MATIAAVTVAQAWSRKLSGAFGVALLVPGTLAVALLLLGGGFGSLGRLGEVFSGPATPPLPQRAAPASVHVRAPRSTAATTTSVRSNPHAGLAAPASGGGTGARTQSPGVASGQGFSAHQSPTAPAGSTRPLPPPPHRPSPPASIAPSPPVPAPPPTLVDGVVAAATGVTSQLPAPVGSVASAALQSVGSTLDGLTSGAQR